MRAVVQRVSRASVTIEGETVAQIGRGLVVLLGVGIADRADDADYLAGKIAALRVFEDAEGKMNRSVADVGGQVLVISQFTLWGDCRKGRRPSFTNAAPPELAEPLYERLVSLLRQGSLDVATGRFRQSMAVELVNNGPVTLLLDSRRLF